MNHNGWGLSTLLGFLVILGIFLIVVAILYSKNFSNINKINEEELEKEQTQEEIEETIQEETEYNTSGNEKEVNEKDYGQLETLLKDCASKYISSKKISSDYKIVITYNDIKEANLIDNLTDPKNGNICNGYVVYYNNELNPFVRCIGNYQTNNYDEELE